MNPHALEHKLLSVFQLALAQRNFQVANHILTAIEELDRSKDGLNDTATEAAYLALARLVSQSRHSVSRATDNI